MSEVEVYTPPIDVSTLMPRTEAEAAIGGFEARIAALEGRKGLALLATATVGETVGLGVSLGVRRYILAVAGAVTTDKLVVALTGAPANGTLQDAYVSSAGNVSVGVLVPAVGVGVTVAVPVAIYRVV